MITDYSDVSIIEAVYKEACIQFTRSVAGDPSNSEKRLSAILSQLPCEERHAFLLVMGAFLLIDEVKTSVD